MDTSRLLLLKMMKGFLECFNRNQTTRGFWTWFSKLYFNENLAVLFLEAEGVKQTITLGLVHYVVRGSS